MTPEEGIWMSFITIAILLCLAFLFVMAPDIRIWIIKKWNYMSLEDETKMEINGV